MDHIRFWGTKLRKSGGQVSHHPDLRIAHLLHCAFFISVMTLKQDDELLDDLIVRLTQSLGCELEAKLHRSHRQEVSQLEYTRSRREHVGKHNWYRAWNPMPMPVKPKLSRWERQEMDTESYYQCTGMQAPPQWDESENVGDWRTAARRMHWRRRTCCCVQCADLYSSMLNSYTRLQKSNLQTLLRRYQTAKNVGSGQLRALWKVGHGSARKIPAWTDCVWEIEADYLDQEECPSRVDCAEPGKQPPSRSVDLIEFLKPTKPSKKNL